MAWLVHISDLHFGEEDATALSAVEGFIRERDTCAIIVSGDVTAIGRKAEFDAAFAWLNTLPAPLITTPGNHDTPYYDLLPRLFSPFRQFFEAAQGAVTQPHRLDGLALAPINTARGVQLRKNWALGAVSGSQIAQTCSFLQEQDDADWRIVITHHPLVWPADAPIRGSTRGGARARARFLDAGADMFLSGHLHKPHIELIGGSTKKSAAISAPTLSVRQRGSPAGFVAIEILHRQARLWPIDIGRNGSLQPSAPTVLHR